jgi:uncharacterized membrane protein YfcA
MLMSVWVWLGAIMVGLSLGLLGSGGSFMTIPILIYVVGQEEKVAFASALAIVGMISFFSALSYARSGQIEWRSVVWFGFPGMVGAVVGVYFARYIPAWTQMMLFAVLLFGAAYLMFRPFDLKNEQEHEPRAVGMIVLDGLVVGAVTGIVGVGGGFLIIPALVLLGGLSMSLAVGTSLVIITMKSLSGFWEYLHVLDDLHLSLDWEVILLFGLLGIVGGQIGHLLNSRLPQDLLRKLFAGFLVMMGTFIFWQNLPKLTGAFS